MWKKRCSTATDVRSAIEAITGRNADDLIVSLKRPEHGLKNLQAVCDAIAAAMRDGKPISIIGDYDADGITAASILRILFLTLKYSNVRFVIPRRFSDGYGAKPYMIDDLDPGLLIMVDNGITCHDAIDHARDRGFTTVILDHHLPGESIPAADVVIDPAIAGTADSPYYCGAGLALCVALETLPKGNVQSEIRDAKVVMMVLAAIGTIADCVPLFGDNRWIVAMGARSLKRLPRRAALTNFLKGVELNAAKSGNPTFEFPYDVGFKIAPCFNAWGRLEDDGAREVFDVVSQFDPWDPSFDAAKCGAGIARIMAKNDDRKILTRDLYPLLKDKIEAEGLSYDKPIVVKANLPQGLVGIFAGKIADEYHTPAIVFAEGEDDVLHGSARSYGNVNIRAALDACAPCIDAYGGHAGAAGLSVRKTSFTAFHQAIKEALKDVEIDDTRYFDLEATPEECEAVLDELQVYAPFGQECPMPVLKVNKTLKPTPTGFIAKLGAGNEHLKCSLTDRMSAIGFGLVSKFEEMGQPRNLTLYGTPGFNYFNGDVYPQLSVEDISEWKEGKKTILTPLAERLKAAAANA